MDYPFGFQQLRDASYLRNYFVAAMLRVHPLDGSHIIRSCDMLIDAL